MAAPARAPHDQSMLRLRLCDARCLLRHASTAELAGKVVGRMRSALRSEQELWILCKPLDEVVRPPGEPTLRLEPLERRHLAALHELNVRRCAARKTRRFAADLDRGYRGFVGFRDGVLVGYYWWAGGEAARGHRDIVERGLGIEVAPDEVYGFDFYLGEEHRGGGTAPEFLFLTEAAIRDLGYRRLWGYVEADNRPARWVYATRGYRQVRKLVACSRLGRRSTREVA